MTTDFFARGALTSFFAGGVLAGFFLTSMVFVASSFAGGVPGVGVKGVDFFLGVSCLVASAIGDEVVSISELSRVRSPTMEPVESSRKSPSGRLGGLTLVRSDILWGGWEGAGAMLESFQSRSRLAPRFALSMTRVRECDYKVLHRVERECFTVKRPWRWDNGVVIMKEGASQVNQREASADVSTDT